MGVLVDLAHSNITTKMTPLMATVSPESIKMVFVTGEANSAFQMVVF